MPVQRENLRARQIIVGLTLIVVAAVTWLLFGPLRNFANENDGFIAAIGIFVLIPFALLTNRFVEKAHQRKQAANANYILIHELWHNLNHVGQIEQSYNNNFEWFDAAKKPAGVHVPKFGPRTVILEKFVTVEHLVSMDPNRAWRVMEIYAQLCALKDEFPVWKENLGSTVESEELYVLFGAKLLSIIEPVMRNMMDVWVQLLATAPFKPQAPQIAKTALLIRSRITLGQILLPTYKASHFKIHARIFGPKEKIICWCDDWKDSPVEVIELSSVAALHPSWQLSKRA